LIRQKIKFLAARRSRFPGEESGLHFENKITAALEQKKQNLLVGTQ
jgi:hypothetical protein